MQMVTQANQIAALVHVQKMVENNIDSELVELSRHCQKEKVGVSFLNCGVKTSNGFEKGVLAVCDYKTPAIGKIARPRMAQILRAVNNEKDGEDEEPYFEMVGWSDDERKLRLDQIGTLALVSDTEGNIVVAVSHSEAYHDTLAAFQKRNIDMGVSK
ncbi:hypothetical protein DFJ43DRAFT_1044763 [Lentinula guzmanii]|uniref:Uncharacterized protein n=1 Tax=Lentinula guzmanii TaxID=2804957 RepID=A0AA38J1L0_9AGAR|nr:hypothetical protein DFJ43DRAFT_1044763 [Lentinula guzmanii]